ncbi:MAG TPA: UDP-N-acetylmuramoyl-L-alanyl-D-glutamate--2,6-diaminopimelate ligase [Thermoanaerobaculia bacterium]|nr:UDP-N-acetylmuramoyl-L-alanyl-D-glutamate--2,6-diaminopimelate ligase [Thermoanaerobaculia bacterium]
MKLHRLLDGVDAVAKRLDESAEISLVTVDSRHVIPGALFVAVPGLIVDGHDFIEQAIRRGATAIVSEKPLSREAISFVQVRDSREALARIAANFYDRPAEKLRLIGVTGTSGKTTTTKMVESILEATGEPVGLIGTIEYRAGSVREIADRTTPDAIVLHNWFARMVDEGVRLAVMEVSSHALALRRTYGIPFAAAAFTNLSRDHFDFHKDFEDYFAAKKMLFDQIDRTRPSGVVNGDDEYGRRLATELGPAAMTFGRGDEHDIHPGPGFEVAIGGLHGTLITPMGPIRVDSPLLGWPNLYNWMAAAGVALAAGIERDAIEEGIRNLKTVRGRFEQIESDGGEAILVDYAHKPDALEKLLRAVRELAPSRRILLVFGCGGDRDAGKRPLMGAIAATMADRTIVTSDNPRGEDPLVIIRQIEDGYREAGRGECEAVPDRREAIARAVAEAGPDTVVVIAGKGHETYQVVGDEILHFDDREEVEFALRKKREKSIR